MPHISSNRWSCVRYSTGNAWNYNNNGMSNNNGFANSLAVRPVTKLSKTAILEMDFEDLYEAHRASRKHNRRSEDMVAFEVDLYANLRRNLDKINSRSYVPLHNYSFMHRRNQTPREVFAAEPELKGMMAYALNPLMPLIEKRLSPRTFNNRIGMGAHLAVDTLIEDIYTVSEGYTRPCTLIKLDYRGYFPNMVRQTAFRQFLDIIDRDYHGRNKDDIIYCLETACFTSARRSRRKSPLWEWEDYPDYKSVYRKPDGIGGFIGYTFWQTVASLYPMEVDRYIAENMSPHFVRYVDDTVIVIPTENKETVLSMIPGLRDKLGELGITLHPKKFYCQPYEHGVEFLGYHILPGRIHLKHKTIARAMSVARSHGRGKRNYMDAINSYLGMIKSTSDIDKAKALLDAVNRPGFEKDYNELKLVMK